MTASVSSHNHIFIGIDVGGASFEAAWHRGGSTHCQNRPDAIAAFVARLSVEKQIIRIAVEPTGGYEKPLVKALRGAGLPVEMVHTSRFAAYRTLIGVKAKSDTSDARLLAAYAAAPEEVRGRKAGYVVLPQDAMREQLAELAARRDQLKHMIHAETCRLSTVRSQSVRDEITAHLQALRQADCKTHDAMMQLVHQRDELRNAKWLLKTIKGIGDKTALTSIAAVPELGLISNKAAAALVGVAPFVRPERNHERSRPHPWRPRTGTQCLLHGRRHRQPAQSRPCPFLRPPDRSRKAAKGRSRCGDASPGRLRQCRPQIRAALERSRNHLTRDTVDSGLPRSARAPE